MGKKMHGGNEESHGSGGWFSGLFKNTNDNEHKSSGLLSGFFQNSGHSSSTGHSETGLTFQKIVSYIAAIILAGTLSVIGFMIYNSKSSMKYPPEVAECPDYWMIDGSGNNATCVNVKDLGTCPAQTGQKHLSVNFNNSPFTGSNELCSKYTWAKNCRVSWDGITYGVNNPCQTS